MTRRTASNLDSAESGRSPWVGIGIASAIGLAISTALLMIIRLQSPPGPQPLPDAPWVQKHAYALEENGSYGYKQTISDADRTNGVGQKPLVMIRYLGQVDGEFTIEVPFPSEANGSMVMSCKLPCEYYKRISFHYGVPQDTEIVPSANTIAAAIFQDAISGQLRPYQASKAQ